METRGTGPRRNRLRGSTACDGRGTGGGRRRGGGRGIGKSKDDSSLATRTAMRAVVAAGTYVAQDMRDREGLTRPMLRRAALRMAVSRQPALRRLGTAYLRTDPPAPEELPERTGLLLPSDVRPLPLAAAPQALTTIDVTPAAGRKAV
jgi:hypothetical protein